MKISIVASALAFGLIACAATPEDVSSSEDAITPAPAKDDWGRAGYCSENIARQSAVRAQELAGGVVRWQCGDRPGVDGEDDRGQEYCEYFAVSGGKRINSISKADTSKPLSCFFTSVYADVDGKTSVGAIDRSLATALSSKENFNASFGAELVRMKNGVNSRGAATTLIGDAQALKLDKKLQQKAACFLAGKKSDAECHDVKVAAPDEPGYEAQQDLYACMSVNRLANQGVDWRMSDPHITAVTVRATSECGCQYSELPDALQGFLQGTWSSADQLPPGCRRAKVDGKDSQQLTICDIPAEEVSDIALNLDVADNLQKLCNDRFGKDIVLTAPLRAIEKKGSCKATDNFCKAFTANE